MSQTIRILIVDDNDAYRQALRRNLALQKFEVIEAENSDRALEAIESARPDVLITDLQMRTRREGLDLIQEALRRDPLLPVIMISAVGTFEEGAAASRMGAAHVISKSNIEEEIGRLHRLVRAARDQRAKALALLAEIESIRAKSGEGGSAVRLREILSQEDAPDVIKGEAYDLLLEITGGDPGAGGEPGRVDPSLAGAEGPAMLREVEKTLASEVPAFQKMTPEAQEALRTAEFLFQQGSRVQGRIDLSRSIGFSYCFAVECEAKAVLGGRIHRPLQRPQIYELIGQVLEGPDRRLGVFFHQAILQVLRAGSVELTAENVRQTLMRILEHRTKYKPDGLKAIAVILLCFGREYEVRTARSSATFSDLLGLAKKDGEATVLRLARSLAQLQHFRNPYIHPEINDREKIPAIRSETLECLRMLSGLS